MKINHKCPFYLVDPSFWPLAASLVALFTTLDWIFDLFIINMFLALFVWPFVVYVLLFLPQVLFKRRRVKHYLHHFRKYLAFLFDVCAFVFKVLDFYVSYLLKQCANLIFGSTIQSFSFRIFIFPFLIVLVFDPHVAFCIHNDSLTPEQLNEHGGYYANPNPPDSAKAAWGDVPPEHVELPAGPPTHRELFPPQPGYLVLENLANGLEKGETLDLGGDGWSVKNSRLRSYVSIWEPYCEEHHIRLTVYQHGEISPDPKAFDKHLREHFAKYFTS